MDPIVENVREKYHRRSELGLLKYGTTLAENNHDDFIEHAIQEAMDLTLYLTKIKEILKSKGYEKLQDIDILK